MDAPHRIRLPERPKRHGLVTANVLEVVQRRDVGDEAVAEGCDAVWLAAWDRCENGQGRVKGPGRVGLVEAARLQRPFEQEDREKRQPEPEAGAGRAATSARRRLRPQRG
jgi:hypothetical protein